MKLYLDGHWQIVLVDDYMASSAEVRNDEEYKDYFIAQTSYNFNQYIWADLIIKGLASKIPMS
jgi:hypothetical protein